MKDSQGAQEKSETVAPYDKTESLIGQPGALQRTPMNEYVIICRDCLEQEVIQAQRMSQVEHALRREGWCTRSGQWYCSRCAPSRRRK